MSLGMSWREFPEEALDVEPTESRSLSSDAFSHFVLIGNLGASLLPV
jgi:hypothetical protein